MTILSQSAPLRITEALVIQTCIALTTAASNKQTSQANKAIWYPCTPGYNVILTPIRDKKLLQKFKIYHLQANLSQDSFSYTVHVGILNSTKDFSVPLDENPILKFRTSIAVPHTVKDKTLSIKHI